MSSAITVDFFKFAVAWLRRAQNIVVFFSFIITPVFGCNLLSFDSFIFETAFSDITRPDRLIISDIGDVSVVSASSPSWDTLAVDLTRAIPSFAVS
jgi:hypothetical protein